MVVGNYDTVVLGLLSGVFHRFYVVFIFNNDSLGKLHFIQLILPKFLALRFLLPFVLVLNGHFKFLQVFTVAFFRKFLLFISWVGILPFDGDLFAA